MAQAILGVHVSEGDHAAVKEDMLPAVQWSGEAVDARFIRHYMETKMERMLGQLRSTGRCPRSGCNFYSLTRAKQVIHIEGHCTLYISGWDCRCLSLANRHTTAKHLNEGHRGEQAPVMQMDGKIWLAIHCRVPGVPYHMPRLRMGTWIPAQRMHIPLLWGHHHLSTQSQPLIG